MKLSLLNSQAIGLILGLVVQFLLGIAINLYVQFPANQTREQLWSFAFKQWLVVAHLVVGVGLVLGSIIFLIRSIRQKSLGWKILAAIGLIAVLIAWASGEEFVSTQADIWSFVMSIGFGIALLAYSWGLYASSNFDSKY